jgi:hypothetical protein
MSYILMTTRTKKNVRSITPKFVITSYMTMCTMTYRLVYLTQEDSGRVLV